MSSNPPSIIRIAQILDGDVMAVHESQSRRLVGLSDKPPIDPGGQVRCDDQDNAAYTPLLQLVYRNVADAFSERAIEALLKTRLLAFDLEPAP